MTDPTIALACPRGGEIVDYTTGRCDCDECPTPRADWAAERAAWKPPGFATDDAAVDCPRCAANPIQVRASDEYLDSSDYEAYCSECHAELTVCASVEITFFDAELVK